MYDILIFLKVGVGCRQSSYLIFITEHHSTPAEYYVLKDYSESLLIDTPSYSSAIDLHSHSA